MGSCRKNGTLPLHALALALALAPWCRSSYMTPQMLVGVC